MVRLKRSTKDFCLPKQMQSLPAIKTSFNEPPLTLKRRMFSALCCSGIILEKYTNFCHQELISKKYPEILEYLNERKIKGEKAKWGEELFNGVLEHLEEIDEVIKNHLSKEWDFDRLDNVDKAILRLGVYEELFTDLPYQVVINEAIEIAKLLSSESSTRFINGMLDKIAKEKNETMHSS